MLSIVSDLHFSDASVAQNIHSSALTDVTFPQLLAAARAKAAGEVRIVLLGDSIDLPLSDYWVKEVPAEQRPWNGTLDGGTLLNTHAAVEGHYCAVLERILRGEAATAFIAGVKALRRRLPGFRIGVTCIPGNHDRAFHNYPALRRMFGRALGPGVELSWSASLLDEKYGVLARHGHEWDEHCHAFDLCTRVLHPKAAIGRFDPRVYAVQTIGEAITAELFAGLIHRVRSEGRSGRALLPRLIDVHHIRPITDAFAWLEWLGRSRFTAPQKTLLLDALRDSIAAVLDTALARRWDDVVRRIPLFRGDITDRLGELLSYIRGRDFDSLKREVLLFESFRGLLGSSRDEFAEGAQSEFSSGSLPASVQYVVYGHTHETRQQCFSAAPDGTVQMYINTGTYLPLIERASTEGFSREHQMSLAMFYRGSEDRKRKAGRAPSMELWWGRKRKSYRDV